MNGLLSPTVSSRSLPSASALGAPDMLHETVHQLGVVFCRVSPDARFLYTSEGWASLLGYPEGSLVGTNALDVVHPDDLPSTLAALARVVEAGEVVSVLLRILDVHGEVHWMRFDARFDGEVIHTVAFDASNAHEARREHENTRQLVGFAEDVAKLASWRLDVRTGAQEWSEQLYSLYGLDPSQPPPSIEVLSGFTHPDDRESLERGFQTRVSDSAVPRQAASAADCVVEGAVVGEGSRCSVGLVSRRTRTTGSTKTVAAAARLAVARMS
jgi:PAS domain S-box-containing protein